MPTGQYSPGSFSTKITVRCPSAERQVQIPLIPMYPHPPLDSASVTRLPSNGRVALSSATSAANG
jgi:hypothetical protein